MLCLFSQFYVSREPAFTDGMFASYVVVHLLTVISLIRVYPYVPLWFLASHLLPHLTMGTTVDTLLYGSITFYGILSLLVFSQWMASLREKQTILLLRWFVIFQAGLLFVMSGSLYGFPDTSQHLMYYDRLKGFFKDPNVFASYLLWSLYWFLYDTKWNNVIRITGIALVGGAIYFTGSRVALVCTLIPLFLKWRDMSFRSLLLIIVVCTGIGSYLWMGTERYTLQAYDLTRFHIQWEALQLAWQYPFGIGAGNAEEALHHSPHQTYIRVLLEHGFIGLIGYLLGIGYLMKRLIYTKELLGQVGMAFLVSLLTMNFVIDTLHWRHAWIFVGLAIGRGGQHHSNCISHYPYAAFGWRATSRPSSSGSSRKKWS